MNAIMEIITETKTRSAWSAGVKEYAMELLEDVSADDLGAANTRDKLERLLLNGAPSWKEYSWGGCSLIYDGDIARRLCAPWELRKTDNGRKNPNAREQWLDTQARALYQAFLLVLHAAL